MSAPFRLIEKAFIVVIVFLVFVIVVTTVWALVSRDGGGRKDAAEGSAVVSGGVAEQSFTGVRRQRAVLRGERGGAGPTVIVWVVFPYDAADRAFTEELAGNIVFFRETVSAYFGAMTAADPRLRDEAVMKAELLGRFNARLRLGKIGQLFFSEFLIID
jgi:flagellar basal body-associated protein FliL